MKLLVILAAVFVVAYSVKWSDEFLENFKQFETLNHKEIFLTWKGAFGKTYDSLVEESQRFAIWLDNYRNILKHNHNPLRGNYTLRLNQFADLTSDEFRYYVHGHSGSCLKKNVDSKMRTISTSSSAKKVEANPTSVDWRTQGVVTPIKNQGDCGSCWAFSATGSTECRYAIATGSLNSLSEQQLVDCSKDYGNMGCDGGYMEEAFRYIHATGGLCTETEYPYTAKTQECKSSSCGKFYDPINNFTAVTSNDEQDLETAVVSGCVSVGIEADQFAFQYYSSGILNGDCGTSIDHGVLVVGYGADGENEYWIVKNSWGTSWGEDGYVLICKDCGKNGNKGECGINQEPSFPNAA